MKHHHTVSPEETERVPAAPIGKGRLMARFLSTARNPAFLIISAYAALSLFSLCHHEPYRDEAQAWLIVRSCPDLKTLFHQMGYEGTPGLWHLLLLPLARLGLPFITASLLNYMVMLSVVILLVTYAPFSVFHKALLVFGYFFSYEYSVFARSYSLTVLLLFLIATFYRDRFSRPILQAFLLLLLANTNLHGLVMAFVLFCLILVEMLFINKRHLSDISISWLSITLTGFAVSVMQLWPPNDVLPPRVHQGGIPSLLSTQLTYDHLIVISKALTGAFLPIPSPELNFWNSHLVYLPIDYLRDFNSTPNLRSILYSLSLLLPAGLSVGLLARKSFPLLLYSSLSLGLISIFFLIYQAGVRHQGLIYIVFIFCLWVSSHYTEEGFKKFPLTVKAFDSKNHHRYLTLLLSFQLIATPVACFVDWKYDFSSGKRAAHFLKESIPPAENVLIATYQSSEACAILPYLKPPFDKFYFLEYQDECHFMTWNRLFWKNRSLSAGDILNRIEARASGTRYDSVFFISNRKITPSRFRNYFELVASFDNTIEQIESFYIYRLKTMGKEGNMSLTVNAGCGTFQ
jgi:hypothetical protein